ncbi:MAG: hypothetical protein QW818_03670 [Candidatus Aenigmatarchaeota archaeon]|nr:hypothetical protein [Candidatus Aenigmarchaeota archaeon]
MKVYIIVPLAHRFDESTREEFIKLVNLVDSILKEFKFSTYITYRDFLQWGRITYNPNTVFEKLELELKTSDLVVALNPNEGIGSNITLGIAATLKKFIIILLNKEFDISSLPGKMYQGFNKITKCEILVYSDVDDLKKKLRKTIREFLKSRK